MCGSASADMNSTASGLGHAWWHRGGGADAALGRASARVASRKVSSRLGETTKWMYHSSNNMTQQNDLYVWRANGWMAGWLCVCM